MKPTLHKNADRVAAVFNALSVIVVIIGVLVACRDPHRRSRRRRPQRAAHRDLRRACRPGWAASSAAWSGGALIYTVIVWAGIQLSAIVAGYIQVKTTSAGPPVRPSVRGEPPSPDEPARQRAPGPRAAVRRAEPVR